MADDALTYLFSLEQFGIKLGLDNIQAILEELGRPERSFATVHVAGTNGKGSVTAMVDSVLRAAGHHAARYTSPHLVDLRERFVVDGQPVSQETLIAALATVRDAVVALQARGRLEVHPTFFEVTTATAFEVFRRASAAIAVCEVGLGGRLDATNVLSPVVSAITTIALDHQLHLGTTLADIAAEKAGIIKPGVPVVTGEIPAPAMQVIEQIARQRGAPVIRARADVAVERLESLPDGGQAVRLRTRFRDYGTLAIGLAGDHQIDNAIVAVRLLELLDERGIRVPADAMARGLAAARWPGRLERLILEDGRTVLLDAAHNTAGALALAEFLSQDPVKRPLVFGVMRDKDAAGMLEALAGGVSAVFLTEPSNPRATDPLALAEIARAVAPEMDVHVVPSPHDAILAAWRLDRSIVVAGSIFLLGDVMKSLGGVVILSAHAPSS